MKKIFKYLKPYTIQCIAVIILVFFECICQLFLPKLMANIVDIGIINSDFGFIGKMGVLMLGITLIEIIITLLVAYLSSKISISVGSDLRKKLFLYINKFSMFEMDKIGTSSLITRITNDVIQIQTVIFIMLRLMLLSPIMAIGGIAMALSTDIYLSRVLIISLPLLIAVIVITAVKAMPLFNKMQTKIDEVNKTVREKLIGIRVIRAFNKTEYENKRFDKENKELTGITINVNLIMATLLPVIMLIMNITTVAIIYLSAGRINSGNMQIGTITAFIEYTNLILFSLTMMAMIFVMLPRAITCANRIDEVLDTPISIKNDTQTKEVVGKEIEFKNVSTKYFGSDNLAIENISFKAKKGSVTAIVGGTGSGKSTILNLLMRYYDVTQGEILIDGINIKQADLKKLRSLFSYIPQKAILFSGTIRENMLFGKQDATDEQINYALETAHANEFISTLPNGLDEMISQGGTNFSGGQKQRLAIARAIVKNAPIYIFDDSFSALDYKTDSNLRKSLEPIFKDAIVIVVAQRISTIKNADNIIMLEDGEIIASGTHNELMDTCQAYNEVASSQSNMGGDLSE